MLEDFCLVRNKERTNERKKRAKQKKKTKNNGDSNMNGDMSLPTDRPVLAAMSYVLSMKYDHP